MKEHLLVCKLSDEFLRTGSTNFLQKCVLENPKNPRFGRLGWWIGFLLISHQRRQEPTYQHPNIENRDIICLFNSTIKSSSMTQN